MAGIVPFTGRMWLSLTGKGLFFDDGTGDPEQITTAEALTQVQQALLEQLQNGGSAVINRRILQKGADYTLEAIDAKNTEILVSSNNSITIRIPSTSIIPVGGTESAAGIPIIRRGPGAVILAPEPGVTLLPQSPIILDTQYTTAWIRPIEPNTWLVSISSAAGSSQTVVGGPAATVAPVISGNPVRGNTLSTTNGTWVNSPSFTYQWLRSGSPILGATTNVYTTVAADEGFEISCTVTGTVTGYLPVTIPSANKIIVVAPSVTKPQNTSLPTITGANTINSVVTVFAGTWTNSPVGYRFQRKFNGVNSGAVVDQSSPNLNYTLVDADQGKELTYEVRAYNGTGQPSETGDPATTLPFAVATSSTGGQQFAWVQIAAEGQTFEVTQNNTLLRWGTSPTGQYFETTRNIGTYIANNAEFGDPAPGADKWVFAWQQVGSGGGGGSSGLSVYVNPLFLGMHWHRDVVNWSGAGPLITNYPFEFGLHRLMSKEGKIRWSQVNPSPGVYDWEHLDIVVSKLPAGAKIELVVAGPPDHARDFARYGGAPSSVASGWGFVPVKEASYKDFLRAYIARYGAYLHSIDPANEWNLLGSYTGNHGSADDNILAGYAAGPVTALVDLFRWTREVLTEMNRSDIILWLGSTTGARQIFSVIDRFPEVKTICNGAQIHGYEQTADNWGVFEPTDYLSVMRAGLDSRGLQAWKLSDGEHGITGAGLTTWWNTLVHLASLGWWNVGVYSGDDDGDGGLYRGGNPIGDPAVAQMYQDFHDNIAGRWITAIDKSTARWTVTTSATQP